MKQMIGNMEEFVKSIPDFQINCDGIWCLECPLNLENAYSVNSTSPSRSCARNIIASIKAELERRVPRRCNCCGQILDH